MFNSYAYAGGGHASASANNYLKINAISGTLVKNHPKSIFVIAKADDTIFDPTNPRCRFPKAEKQKVTKSCQGYNFRPGQGWDTEYYTVEEHVDVEVPCVVLQSMIIGDGLFSCEIVKLSDFYARDPAPYKKWCGKEVTVSKVDKPAHWMVYIEEDDGVCFFMEEIECVIEEAEIFESEEPINVLLGCVV